MSKTEIRKLLHNVGAAATAGVTQTLRNAKQELKKQVRDSLGLPEGRPARKAISQAASHAIRRDGARALSALGDRLREPDIYKIDTGMDFETYKRSRSALRHLVHERLPDVLDRAAVRLFEHEAPLTQHALAQHTAVSAPQDEDRLVGWVATNNDPDFHADPPLQDARTGSAAAHSALSGATVGIAPGLAKSQDAGESSKAAGAVRGVRRSPTTDTTLYRLARGKVTSWRDALGLPTAFADIEHVRQLLQTCGTPQEASEMARSISDQLAGDADRRALELRAKLPQLPNEQQRRKAADAIDAAERDFVRVLGEIEDAELDRRVSLKPESIWDAARLLTGEDFPPGQHEDDFPGEWELMRLAESRPPDPAQILRAKQSPRRAQAMERRLADLERNLDASYGTLLTIGGKDVDPAMSVDCSLLAGYAYRLCRDEIGEARRLLAPSDPAAA